MRKFTGAHPNISDADLVQLLYNNSLGRPADNFEVNYWTTKGYDQATIANMIINSPEAIIRSGIAGQAGF